MSLLLNAQALTKAWGAQVLFREIDLSVHEGDRLGLIGPNGAGKSTLLQILGGLEPPDSGEVALRKLVRSAYVQQESNFPPGLTVRGALEEAAADDGLDPAEVDLRVSTTLSQIGFEDEQSEAERLSGGWRKRLAVAQALVRDPDVLLLDEPTNHLDLDGIVWLEKILTASAKACIVISHDRYFLENVCTSTAELSRAYPDGLFRATGSYSKFLEKKAEYRQGQQRRQDALENRLRTEIEWLRRGPKARTSKSRTRIDAAHSMMDELSAIESRQRTSTANIDFSSSERRTKRLLEAEGISLRFGEQTILRDVDLTLINKARLGLVGPNGSGKTTLLRVITGELEPQAGTIRRAANLRTVYFSQDRKLDAPSLTLQRALAPDGDSVIYRGNAVHVAAWADRFLFRKDQLVMPVGDLSGGERARLLIANLMRQPADVLLLDEPTNDLDIPTLEVLEESLLEFPGAIVLVTHDRYLMDRVCTALVALDGTGALTPFADFHQWADSRKNAKTAPESSSNGAASKQKTASKKLSYKDQREWDAMEGRILEAEERVEAATARLNDPATSTDPAALEKAYAEQSAGQAEVDNLYARWAELESKLQ